jgi:RNA polymerase sigma factor for flagellar operon FliA
LTQTQSHEFQSNAYREAARQYGEISNLDQEERDRLVMDNLQHVYYIARRIHEHLPQHVPMDDLVNAGVVGLLEAVRNYDPSRNTQLRTYAKIRIRGAILDSLRDLDWGTRGLRRKGRAVEQAQQRLRTSLGRAPNEAELAVEMGVELTDLQRLLMDLRGLDLGSIQSWPRPAGVRKNCGTTFPMRLTMIPSTVV